MRALGYIRVSTRGQAQDGHSLEVQQARLQAWCIARQLELVGTVVDAGVSASKPLARRPGGARLLARMAAGEADTVVVVTIDRLFRDARDGLNTLLGSDGRPGLPVQSVAEPLDTSSAMGRFITHVWLAKAELERAQTCERTRAVVQRRREAGLVVGTTPYGTQVIGGRLYRDPATWPQRELIIQLRGQGAAARPYSEIAAELRRRGIASPSGKPGWGKTAIARVVRTHGALKDLPAAPAGHETPVSAAEEANQ
jgi:Site-specific recombinases, DNA invertase Pin homologs